MILTVREGLRRLHHRLIRLRLMSEHNFGQLTLTDRLLHIRPMSGLVLSAPALLFILWYSGLAVSTHVRQTKAVETDEPLTPELFQLLLHDRLAADARRLRMPEPLNRSELPTYNMMISNDRLSQLDANLPPEEGRGNYVEGFLQNKNRVYEIEVRYRGTKHWHWNNPQKSWKIRVKGDHLMFEGLPTFNFINTPDPMPFNEQMVLDVARDAGLLTPAYYPFRLQLNNAFLGVYFFEAQPDEGLLRRARRLSGSIYSGAGAPLDPQTQTSSLWESSKHWKKVGAIGDKTAHDVRELDALLKAIQRDNAEEFATFAESTLDVDKFATFDAIDVVFGNNQHDYDQNHKLYFDPYKNRFEPIATEFRDMAHERQFNRTEYPLLLRLKQLPDYLTLRNRKVYEFITGSCSPQAIAERTAHWTEVLEPDLTRDPYWDAYELLPSMGNYYRQLVRPMTIERQALAAKLRLHEHTERVAYLRRELEHLELSATLHAPLTAANTEVKPVGKRKAGAARKDQEEAPPEYLATVDVTVGGPAAFDWLEAIPSFAAGCVPGEWQLFADREPDQILTPERDLRLAAVAAPLRVGKPDITLPPGVTLRQVNPHPAHGRVRADVEARSYRFFLRSTGCPVTGLMLDGKNTATEGAVSLEATRLETAPTMQPNSCEDRRGFIEPGSKSLHPFCYPFEPEETVRLGPGRVEISKTRIYTPRQTLIIEPGTDLVLSSGVSIISYGKVIAEGRPDARIRFAAQQGHWGGLAIQGPGTAGSRLMYVDFIAGTKAERTFFDFPGMVSVHDTRDIHVGFAGFSNNEKSDDALHVAYVKGLVVHDVVFEHVLSDALDIEYSTGKLTRLDVIGAGDDGLDLMGSKVEVVDSRFIRCRGNGLSIGEHSDVTALRNLMARGTRAIQLKNSSSLSASEILAYANDVGIRLENESMWYVGTSSLRLDEVHVLRTKLPFDGSRATTTGELSDRLGNDDLDSLRRDVLEIGQWAALDGAIDRLEQRRVP